MPRTHKFTVVEDFYIVGNHNTMTIEVLSQNLGLTVKSVEKRLKELNPAGQQNLKEMTPRKGVAIMTEGQSSIPVEAPTHRPKIEEFAKDKSKPIF